MKKIILSLIIVISLTSCMTFTANISDLSEEEQLIKVSIYKVSFHNNDPLIERITINIENISDSTIYLNPEKSFFRDNNGFHALHIPPISIRANSNVNIPIESLNYFRTVTNMYSYRGITSASSVTSMQDMNVKFIELNLNYNSNGSEFIGIYFIDVEKVETQNNTLQ